MERVANWECDMPIWVIGRECGHQAFSTSKTIDNTGGWILHSAYFIFRKIVYILTFEELNFFFLDSAYLIMLGALLTQNITHQLDVWPKTKSLFPPLDHNLTCQLLTPRRKTFRLLGARVTNEIKKEMWEAIGAALRSASYLVSFSPPISSKYLFLCIYSSAIGLPTSSQMPLVKGDIQRVPLVSYRNLVQV